MDECKIVCRKCASEIPQTTKLFQCPYCGHSGKDWFIYIRKRIVVELGLHQKAHEAVEEELIRIRQVQVTPSFDDIHRIVNRVLALLDDYVVVEKEKLQDLLNDIDCTLTEEDFTFQAIAGFRTKLQEIIDRTDEKAEKELSKQ